MAPKRTAARRLPAQLAAVAPELASLRAAGRWEELTARLEALDRTFPGHPEVLSELTNAYYELNDLQGYQRACERLLRVQPDDPDLLVSLGGAYLANIFPALALRTFAKYLRRWPEHERAEEVRGIVEEVEAPTLEPFEALGLAGPEALELAAAHEEISLLLEDGRLGDARRAAERFLRRCPDFPPVLNNLSTLYASEGRLLPAIQTARKVLESHPDNYHALGNMVRFLVLDGRPEEAREYAEQLKSVQSEGFDLPAKQAEAFSYLGDDAAVLEVFKRTKRGEQWDVPELRGMLLHLAAVATMRQGDDRGARRLWKQSLEALPGFELAQANLDDLALPQEERHAPFPFLMANWVDEELVRSMAQQVDRALKSARPANQEEAARNAMRRFLREHPRLGRLVPILLDRGDRSARELALRVAAFSEEPVLLEALRDFALGQRGPDEARQLAAQAASQAGLLSGTVRMWMGGEWQELLMLGMEIYDEPESKHGRAVTDLMEKATLALQDQDAESAEKLLHQALAVEPGAPDLLNNLRVAYQLQGRAEDARALAERIYAEHPEYFFGRVMMAHVALEEKNYARAHELLDPLLQKRRFHVSEFTAFCEAFIALQLAEERPQAARQWLELWEEADPDHPHQAMLRQRVEMAELLENLTALKDRFKPKANRRAPKPGKGSD